MNLNELKLQQNTQNNVSLNVLKGTEQSLFFLQSSDIVIPALISLTYPVRDIPLRCYDLEESIHHYKYFYAGIFTGNIYSSKNFLRE